MEENLKNGHIKREKIIYIYPQTSSFVEKDIRILSKKYRVITPRLNWNKKELILLNFIQQFIFILKNIRGAQAIFVMFAGYWSFLPALMGKLFNKRVFIIPGGTDCVSFPEINYGSLRKPLLRAFIRQSFKWCSRLLPVSQSLVETEYSYLPGCRYPKQGYRFFFPQIKTPYTVIQNGYDPVFWHENDKVKTTDTFITIASVSDHKRFELKGIDVIFKLAEQFKQCRFMVIGMSESFQRQLESIPPNVSLIGFLKSEQLKETLYENQYYLQLSISEGFPNALSEAMLCGCIPVGSTVGAIPEIIGATGILVERKDMKLIFSKIAVLLSLSNDKKNRLSKAARDRIKKNFHIQKREDAFLKLLNK